MPKIFTSGTNGRYANPPLLFAGLAYENEDYITTYLQLNANPIHPEVIRNLPVRHPMIWLNMSKQEDGKVKSN